MLSNIVGKTISCRTVALRKNFLLTERRATVLPIVKTLYLLRILNMYFSFCNIRLMLFTSMLPVRMLLMIRLGRV